MVLNLLFLMASIRLVISMISICRPLRHARADGAKGRGPFLEQGRRGWLTTIAGMTKDSGKWLRRRPRTRAVRAGIRRTQEQEHGEPIFTSSSFVFDSAEDAKQPNSPVMPRVSLFALYQPDGRSFEERLASLEQGDGRGDASGMSAILALCMAHLKTGDHVLCSRDVFGATVGLFENTSKVRYRRDVFAAERH